MVAAPPTHRPQRSSANLRLDFIAEQISGDPYANTVEAWDVELLGGHEALRAGECFHLIVFEFPPVAEDEEVDHDELTTCARFYRTAEDVEADEPSFMIAF